MNLLKTLQSHLTCLKCPWKPTSNPALTRLINEIVLEEESDIINNAPTSHFSFYIDALTSLNKTSSINQFLNHLHQDIPYKSLISQAFIPDHVQAFLTFTYDSIQHSILHTASAFTFGREALVPELFKPIVNNPHIQSHHPLKGFVAYLDRHIELDGEHHSQLAYDMIAKLCKTPEDWKQVEAHGLRTLEARLKFWDGIYLSLPKSNA